MFFTYRMAIWGFPGGSAGKESTCNVEDLGSIPGVGRSFGEGKGYTLQYSGLEKSMDCSAWGHRVGHNRATFTFTSRVFREIACLPSRYSKM